MFHKIVLYYLCINLKIKGIGITNIFENSFDEFILDISWCMWYKPLTVEGVNLSSNAVLCSVEVWVTSLLMFASYSYLFLEESDVKKEQEI